MPRENRKRGKKHKKAKDEEFQTTIVTEPVPLPSTGEPSWILPSSAKGEDVNPEAPFGYVDADVKAYFRTVDVQIQDWQEHREQDAVEEVDPNEERRLFFVAALTEMHGKEKQLATDPDCSVVLERMSYSMDDFVRRVFIDSLSGSYEILAKHRFASHVCQTLFTVIRDTMYRETKGILPSIPDDLDRGELRSATQLILDISEELLPKFTTLIMDPFGSHVLRSLLILLSPNLSISEGDQHLGLRSKKSSAWKAKQGPMKSVFSDDKGKGKEIPQKQINPKFSEMVQRFVEVVRDELDGNEVRAMAASKVASPCLQLLLEVETDQNMANEPNSLMDRVMVGIISLCRQTPPQIPEASDYLGTLLRDPTSSHLLETITSRCPNGAFDILWTVYFEDKLARLAAHPVANFVLAKAIERVSLPQLTHICTELESSWSKLIKTSRTGVLRASIDRAAVLQSTGHEIERAVYSAFDLEDSAQQPLLVPCILTLLPREDYEVALASNTAKKAKAETQQYDQTKGNHNHLQFKTQGSVLLQSLLRLPEPHNKAVINSIQALPVEEKIKIAHDAAGSRVFDVLLESPTVSSETKRRFVMDFIGHYQDLVDDRIGSRVGDRCWAYADTYLKEKIARSLIPHEQPLAGSFYGKFFARNLNLYALRRKPDEWRNMQSEKKKLQDQTPSNPLKSTSQLSESPSESPPVLAKRKRPKADDEIEELFNNALGKKIKKSALDDGSGSTTTVKKGQDSPEPKRHDSSLDTVLGAIRGAPKEEKIYRKKKH